MKHSKLLLRILSGKSDANIDFDELRGFLARLGFDERIRGSHHVFAKSGIEDLINLQREDRLAKPYQVRQVRRVIATHGLGEQE